ncbi:betaine--homocysteine S-methyltransferase [Microbaculum marinum]|uniref:Betaine--homocysteine S-methyltransferase n=1 Tax=Microbaculum marinum TaxID=1764581 RepID=A0AAW9RYW9_9HYPH
MLLELLAERGTLLADGATGTNYFDRGLMSGDAPELWNVQTAERVAELHREFIESGADIVLTNSFGANRRRLRLHAADEKAREINRRAAEIARWIADRSGRRIVVAGSMGPTGDLLEPLGELSYAEAVEAFAEQAEGLKAGGADVLWIETMSAPDEIRAAAEGAARTGLPFVFTASFDTAGRTMMGVPPGDLPDIAAQMPSRPAGYGANCGVGAPDLLLAILEMSAKSPDAVLIAKGNCGIPQFHGEHIHYSGTPELMADYARLAVDCGARIVGGCCGTTPRHIAAMRAALDDHVPGPRPDVDGIVGRLGPLIMKQATDRGDDDRPRRGRRRGRG